MSTAREPRSEELFRVMQGSDPDAAAEAFREFLVTPGDWWSGGNPLDWAREVARKHAERLERESWPVHKLGGSDWVGNHALIRLGRIAHKVECPPAFLRRVICNTIEWEIGGRGRKGEPWGHEREEVLEWKPAPSSESDSRKLWQNVEFCSGVATAINSLSRVLRPYAILNLLEGQRPVDIARTLKVTEAKARKYVCRALQAIVGRKDAKQLLKQPNSRAIREALTEPEVAAGDGWTVIDQLIQKRRAEQPPGPICESSAIDPGHDFTPGVSSDTDFSQDDAAAPLHEAPEAPPDEPEAGC